MYPPAAAAAYLATLTLPQARAQFNDHVARAFLLDPDPNVAPPAAFKQALAYNARLVTEIRDRGVRVWG